MTQDEQKQQNKAKALLEGCIQTMAALSDLMSHEIELVKTRKRAELQDLVVQKNKLILTYRATLKSIEQDTALVKQAPPEMRNLLMIEGQRLAEITSRNEKALKAAVLATRRLVDSIYSAIRKEALPNPNYTNTTKSIKTATTESSTPSVVISRSA